MAEYLCDGCKKFFGGKSLKKLAGRWLCKNCFKKRNEAIKQKRKEELDQLMKDAEKSANERRKELEESQELVARAYKEKFPDSQEKW